jgi:predicted RNA polymerase sigma factor
MRNVNELRQEMGLLALMLLIDSRRTARLMSDGQLVLLADQDRAWWDRDLIREGQDLVHLCIARNQPGPYPIQAAINAVHSDATSVEAMDWRQILGLYDQLMALAPSAVTALNRAVAVAEVQGLNEALAVASCSAGARRLTTCRPRGHRGSAGCECVSGRISQRAQRQSLRTEVSPIPGLRLFVGSSLR